MFMSSQASRLQFTPRPYQEEGVARLWEEIPKAKIGSVLIAPTGTGKTAMIMMTAQRAQEDGGVLIIVDREEIAEENAIKCEQYLKVPCELELNEQSYCNWRNIAQGGICSAMTSTLQGKRLVRVDRSAVKTIIIDEGHWRKRPIQGGKVNKICAWFHQARIIGFTGSAIRPNNEPLCPHCYDRFVDLGTLWHFIDQGWLVDIERLHLTKVHQKIAWKKLQKQRITEADKLAAWEANGMEAVILFRQAILDYADDRPTVAFCESVNHSKMLADGLNESGKAAEYVASYMLDDETGDRKPYPSNRRRRIKSLLQGGDLQYIANVGVFQEGVDIPELSCVAWGQLTKSWRKLAQGSGRGVRPWPGCLDNLDKATPEQRKEAMRKSPKPNMLLLDPVGITSKHDLVNPLMMVQGDASFSPKAMEFAFEYLRARERYNKPISLQEAVDIAKLRASAWYDAIRSALMSAQVKVDWQETWQKAGEAREKRALPKSMFVDRGLPAPKSLTDRLIRMQGQVKPPAERLHKEEIQAMTNDKANHYLDELKAIRETLPLPGWVKMKLIRAGIRNLPRSYGEGLRLMMRVEGRSRAEVQRVNKLAEPNLFGGKP